MRWRYYLADIFCEPLYFCGAACHRASASYLAKANPILAKRICSGLERRVLGRLETKIPEFQAKVRYCGRPFYFPSRSTIGQYIARGNVWDAMLPKLIEDIVGLPRVILEIGSNIGASIVPIKARFPSVELILVEPLDRYRKFLERNVRGYSSTIIISREVIGDTTGTHAYMRANETTGTPSNADYGSSLVDGGWVPTVTCDDLAERLGLGQENRVIDFLKVDTDGYEEKVFKGATGAILQNRPLIFFEFSPPSLARIGEPAELIKLFKDQLDCKQFLILSASGQMLGLAETFDAIMELKGEDYYVDILTATSDLRWLQGLLEVSRRTPARNG